MNFFTTTSFRSAIQQLTRKPKNGYMSVVLDICETLKSMPDNILRDTNDRIRQEQYFRMVKLRIGNSNQNLPKNDGFRLIYWVSIKSDNLVLLTIYPKRGPLAASNLTDAEFVRLLREMVEENKNQMLQQVDVASSLRVIKVQCSLD
jgi:mRNA-degrading endonuclease RelE of RelBE toxin-antitoxin system